MVFGSDMLRVTFGKFSGFRMEAEWEEGGEDMLYPGQSRGESFTPILEQFTVFFSVHV